jgi:hypothetical protein
MTTKIAYNNVASVSFTNILDIIDTRANVNDPRDIENKKIRKFVYSLDPFETSVDFNLMPFIVVDFPTMTFSKVSADSKYKTIVWNLIITTRCARNGSSNQTSELGVSDSQNIADDLFTTFNSNTILGTLNQYNIRNISFNKTRSDTFSSDSGQTIIEEKFELIYTTRIKVTA